MSAAEVSEGLAAGSKRLGVAFFARPAPIVARDLIGALVVRADDGIVVRLVETEAYLQQDPACHAHQSRTARNEPLWGPAGHAYVYFSYGMHWCLNTTTGRAGHAQGVLLRAAEPLEGLHVMQQRRGDVAVRDLLRGPARLAQALGLDGSWSGRDICADRPRRGGAPAAAGALYLADDGTRPEVVTTPRTGVARGADLPWRFVLRGSRWASPHKRNPRAPAPGAEDLSGVPELSVYGPLRVPKAP